MNVVFAGLLHKTLECVLLENSFHLSMKHFNSIVKIEFTSQLSRLLKSMCLSFDIHFLNILGTANRRQKADSTKYSLLNLQIRAENA